METILIIEDEPELVRVLRSYLENAGFQVMTAYRGDSGLSTWEHRRPDLVILDLNLPGLDGLEVAREIRKKGKTPLIMLTARVEEMDQVVQIQREQRIGHIERFDGRRVPLFFQAQLAGSNPRGQPDFGRRMA